LTALLVGVLVLSLLLRHAAQGEVSTAD
jgi:hypothetical protein